MKLNRFFLDCLTLNLHKIEIITVISKIKNSSGTLACPLQFLFYEFCHSIKAHPATAASLKAVRGGESKLAMANLG